MKKIKYEKITMLFLLFLCTISLSVIGIRKLYLKNKQQEILENKIETFKYIKVQEEGIEKEENIVLEDNSIGLIIIPSINLKAPIYEGTSSSILKFAVRTF